MLWLQQHQPMAFKVHWTTLNIKKKPICLSIWVLSLFLDHLDLHFWPVSLFLAGSSQTSLFSLLVRLGYAYFRLIVLHWTRLVYLLLCCEKKKKKTKEEIELFSHLMADPNNGPAVKALFRTPNKEVKMTKKEKNNSIEKKRNKIHSQLEKSELTDRISRNV